MSFLDENFILKTKTAQKLYHEHAKNMPIIDYHCHLPPEDIASDRKFKNLTEIWLYGDHYKWRAMRTNGIDERYCTGDADDYAKFEKWAETVPYTVRNPLYHWTHMELKRPFGIEKILKPETAREIYDSCTEMLQTDEFSVRGILKQMNVKVICTTDDPADSLEHHQKIKADDFGIKVLPTYRADKAMSPETAGYLEYLQKLEKASGVAINNFQGLKDALKQRHDFFHEQGGRLSDHGLETIYAEDYTDEEINSIFDKILSRQQISTEELLKFKSAMLMFLALMDHEKGWTQQFHLGALRNNNLRMVRELGPDTGFDSIGDFSVAQPLAKFMGRLDDSNQLAKTILYNLNPRDNEVFATMIGNFNAGSSTPGKIQFGSGWWFLDQKDGMEKQMNALSNMGLLSHFVGMLTDSRSFLSYPRHDYFRRILCNLIGNDVENGELPESEMEWLGQMVENICYNNAKNYFNF
ncbi:glucuronate isomerase [Pontibacter beigongshangensis]|uniref:glucuronate isomerase n=1 Tax=Pontibacter beigongshangensis TaxID=2574733 RepID=UPI001650B15A|nr:glucuronate isomerase [Pontibacter beigongshangensis]